MESTQPKHKDMPEEGLTRIHPRIHCVTTPDGGKNPSEAEEITVDAFIETLAEVAMAVAKRRLQRVRSVKFGGIWSDVVAMLALALCILFFSVPFFAE